MKKLVNFTVLEIVGKTRYFGGTIVAPTRKMANALLRRSYKPVHPRGRLSLTTRPFRDGGVFIFKRS